MAYGVYSDRGYREHILERNKNTNKTEVFTQEDQTFTGRKTFLSGVTTSDLEVRTVEVSETLKVKGKDIIDIIDYLPNDVSKENKLTTEAFVNSSIATNTAYFRGTFDSVEDLEAYEGEKTDNDYAFVRTADEFGAISFNRYKYNSQSESWEYEYTLNNSSFTSAQWDAINSGITAELVAKIGDGSAIDDTKTTNANTWSAAKTKAEIETVDNKFNFLTAKIETVDNKFNFSTDEIIIGKWIDGKNIYRKVIDVRHNGLGVISFRINVTDLHINYLVNSNALGSGYNNYGGNKWVMSCITDSGEKDLYLEGKTQNILGKSNEYMHFVILEYTKTTD